jgi:hypothetical protein
MQLCIETKAQCIFIVERSVANAASFVQFARYQKFFLIGDLKV